ncbi:MAG: tetratricopeptide repeat protein [Candidatus Latescibacteria bacterium]|nr:tetratricopeptide repeat protein [Candidatus Latescibacterota bacterium]
MASTYERAGRFRDAAAIYEQASALSPDDPYLLTKAGLVNLRAERTGAALPYLKKAHELAPDYLDALQGLVRVYAAMRDTQRAFETLNRVSALSSGDAATSVEAGLMYRSLGHPREALKAFEEALEANPDIYQAHAELGVLYYERRDYDRAVQAYKTALRLNPYDARTLNNLAWMYAEQSIHLDEALGLSLLALKLDPGQPAYIDTLAEIYYRMGDREQAVALIRRAISIAPELEHYRRQLRKFLAGGRKV